MTSREAYVAFGELANKLNSSDNINIDIGRFVLLYNKNAKVWLSGKVQEDKSSREIDELQQLVKVDVPLAAVNTTNNYTVYQLPDDWYDHISAYAICTKDTCQGRLINANQVKNEEKRLVLFDENWRPDFDFEWLPITVGQDNIQVYFRDFTIESFSIDYYRYPLDIDIAGYQRPDGTPSSDIDPDIGDIYVNEILDLVVADVSKIYQNTEKVQLDLNRIQQDK